MMEQSREAVVALGMFDGMHIGHRALIGRAVALAGEYGCTAAAYTFLNHPMTVLGGGIRMLGAPEERAAVMRALGVTDVYMERFTRAFSRKSPEEFVELLCARWRVRALVAGFNYSFGAGGAGTPETLCALGKEHGFAVSVLPEVTLDGAPVSSTRIRRDVELGAVESAARMLLHPYTLTGTVIANRRIGRRIGFPTANIAPPEDRVLPGRGVYATDAAIDGTTWRAVTNVGTNPTVHGDRLSIETHLLGFDGDAYGKALSIGFLARLRGERRFDSVEALKAQIARDVTGARELAPPVMPRG